jgi:hypothetical protein
MTCNCFDDVCKKLNEHNGTMLLSNMLDKQPRAIVSTFYAGPKKRGARASIMLANYCPFCGEKYPESGTIFDKEIGP